MTNPETPSKDVAVQGQEPSIMSIIADMSKDPDSDVGKLEQLIALKERVEATEAKKAFTAAMFSFHQNPPKIMKRKPVYGKDRKLGPQYHYAEFSDVVAVVRPALLDAGIVATWASEPLGGGITSVTCVLRHKMGHEERSTMSGGPETGGSKNAIQGVGSADSYLRRYTLLSVTGLVAEGEDNDGEGGAKDDQKKHITEAEGAHLVVMMKDKGVTVTEFLKATKLANVSDLLSKNYDHAIKFIEKRGEHNAHHS